MPFHAHPTTSLHPYLSLSAGRIPRPLGLSLENTDPEPQRAAWRGCPTEGWDTAGEREELSLPSPSCLVEQPSGLELNRGSRPGGWASQRGALPQQPQRPRRHWWLLQIFRAMTPSAGGTQLFADWAQKAASAGVGVGVGGQLSKPLPWRGSAQGQASCSTVPAGQETDNPSPEARDNTRPPKV